MKAKNFTKETINIHPEVQKFMTGSSHFNDVSPAAQKFIKAHGGNNLKQIKINSFEENQIKREAENYAQ